VAKTCTQCHSRIEDVHRKVIRGELWEKQPHAIPACVDCHQPHRVRKVFYTQGMADNDCLLPLADLAPSGADGRGCQLADSRHADRLRQCHRLRRPRPAATVIPRGLSVTPSRTYRTARSSSP
jgi:hypothetical protein